MFLCFTHCIVALVLVFPSVNGYMNMDIQWVLQGATFGFQGFFIEFLGLSSALQDAFPQLRFQQTLKDTPEPNMTTFKSLLFRKESEALNRLMSSEYSYSQSYPLPKSVFIKDRYMNLPNRTGCRDCSITRGIVINGGSMAKSELSGVTEVGCCNACRAQQLCIAFQYIDNGSGICSLKSYIPNSEDYHLSILDDPNGVFGIFSSVSEWQLFVNKMAARASLPVNSITSPVQLNAGSIAPVELRYPAPRVVILHGTSCVHQNETVKYRDVNTIWVGRYMLERAELVKSINIDEFSVTSCSAMVDEIWVPTEWHKSHLAVTLRLMGYSSVPAIYVIPEAVDATLFDPFAVDVRGVDDSSPNDIEVSTGGTGVLTPEVRPFIFLSIFKWEYRKGWDILLDSYWKAFSPSDPVELHIHTYVPSFQPGTTNITFRIEAHARNVFGVESLDELAKVVWVNNGFSNKDVDTSTGTVDNEEYKSNASVDMANIKKAKSKAKADSRADMRNLLANADAFVLPTRGEGWGLPIAEAMAMCLPVIITNYSGPSAYLTEENSYGIPIEMQLDDYGYAQPVEKVLIELLLTVFNTEKKGPDGVIRSVKGLAARETMKYFSPTMVVDKIQERLRSLAEMRGWKM